LNGSRLTIRHPAMVCDSEIFVLGGRGLLGSALTRFCERTGRTVTVIGRDNYANVQGRHCKIFVNANGNSRKPLAAKDPVSEFDASVRSVRASLVDFRFQRYVHLSSCDVYSDCTSPASTNEEQVPDPASQSTYGFHKYIAEQCVRHAAKDWLIFRLGGFIGPGLKKNAIFDIIHGGPLFLDPASELQFLHTDRAAEIIFQILDQGVCNDIFNLSGGGVVRLSEVAALYPGSIAVSPGSPIVRYEMTLAKISRYVQPPETRPEVMAFVRQELERTGVFV
jgi:nucleoside-diphosphate-sugar epimerase